MQAATLIDDLEAGYFYWQIGDTYQCVACVARARGIEPVIPSKRNREELRDHDRALYQAKHLVENAFLHLK